MSETVKPPRAPRILKPKPTTYQLTLKQATALEFEDKLNLHNELKRQLAEEKAEAMQRVEKLAGL